MIIMGMPLWAWIIFYVLVLAMLIIDLRMFGKNGQHEVNVSEALRMTAVWIGVSLLFGIGVPCWIPHREIAVDGQSVRIPDAVHVFRHRAKIPARGAVLGYFRGTRLAQHLHLRRCRDGGAV